MARSVKITSPSGRTVRLVKVPRSNRVRKVLVAANGRWQAFAEGRATDTNNADVARSREEMLSELMPYGPPEGWTDEMLLAALEAAPAAGTVSAAAALPESTTTPARPFSEGARRLSAQERELLASYPCMGNRRAGDGTRITRGPAGPA